jgi:hypothetical protein
VGTRSDQRTSDPPVAAEEARPLPPPGINPTSIKLAAIVPLVAVVVLAVVIVLNVSSTKSPSAPPSPKLHQVAGLTTSSALPFAPLVAMGEPPGDIVDSVVVPVGATQVALPHTGGEATSYDRSIVFTTSASAQSLFDFFEAQMKGRGWKVFSTGAPAHGPGIELLAQRGGSDSWFWEQGVVISPTTFSAGGAAQRTEFTLRLYQASLGN